MNILHVYKTYFPDSHGGLEESIRQICIATNKYGVSNSIFTLSKDPNPRIIEASEATIYRSKTTFELSSTSFSINGFRDYKSLISKFDLIHYHFPWPYEDLLHLYANPKVPVLISYISDIVRQKYLSLMYQPLMHKFLNAANRIIANTPTYFESSKILQLYKDKVSVIPLCINESTIPPVNQDCYDKYRNLFGEEFFLFIGVLRYYKGLHILLDAMKGTNYHTIIAGSGPLESELKQKAKELGLTNVTFIGFVTDEEKYALLKLCKGIVFPSNLRSEAFGMTLLEGAIFKKPLITADISSGMSYININNKTGITVEPNSPSSLRKAMTTLYDNDSLCKKMGDNAHNRFQELFSGEVVGKQYANLYEELIKSA